MVSRRTSASYAGLIIISGISMVTATATTWAHDESMMRDPLVIARDQGRYVTISGDILDYPQPTNDGQQLNSRIAVSTIEINGRQYTSAANVRIAWDPDEHDLGNRGNTVVVSGVVEETWDGDRAQARIHVIAGQQLAENRGVRAYANQIHSELLALTSSKGDSWALVAGVVLGDDSGLDPLTVSNMRILGLSHLTAVSGAHVSLVITAVLLAVSRRWPILTGLATLIVLGALVAVVSPEPSVLRATIMGLFVCGAIALKRPSMAFPLLSLTVIGVSLFSPALARTVGFQLSVMATAAIILAGYWLTERLSRLMPNVLAGLLAIPLVAALATFPFLLAIQDHASVWTALANALVAPVIPILTMSGLVGSVILPSLPTLSYPFLLCAELSARWIVTVTDVLIGLPGSGVSLETAFMANSAVFVALIGLTVRLSSRVWMIGVIGIGFVIGLLGGFRIGQMPSGPGNWEVIQCDVGQGSALLARSGDATVLVDVGHEDGGIAQCLTYADISHIDLVIISHFDADHVRGLNEALNHADIDEVWFSENPYPQHTSEWAKDMLAQAGIPWQTVNLGDTYYLSGPSIPFVTVLGPTSVTGSADTTNADSLVVHIATETIDTYVLGDSTAWRQTQIADLLASVEDPRMEMGVRYTAVVIAHHGSADQSARLAHVLAPDISLVSVGDNSYGHPTQQALDIWYAPLVKRTDQCGHIALTADGVIDSCP